MIRFQCPECDTGLRVGDDRAGKLVRCPGCGRAVRAPARRPGEVEVVEELPEVEDEGEIDEVLPAGDEYDEEERPRRRRRRREEDYDDEDDEPPVIRSGRPPPTEDEERRREVVTWDRVMGIVGVLLGVGFVVTAVVFQSTGVAQVFEPLADPYSAGGCFTLLLGLALIVAGVVYTIRG